MNIPLKTKIIESGRLQIELANKLEIPDSHLSKIVNGWWVPKPELQISIAKLLNCRVKDIFQ
jgi:DNA-binding XRE family transcriptional regulator